MNNFELSNSFVADASSSFKMICFGLLDAAYVEVYAATIVNSDWDENAISEVLVSKINNNPFSISRHITAITEKRILAGNSHVNLSKVDSAYRIDIKIGGFGWSSTEYRTEYYIEAKNIYCQSFKKTNNTSMTSHSQYIKRYLETGINNILNGHYPLDTLLLGYVLVGTVQEAVALLNGCLKNDSRCTKVIIMKDMKEFPHLLFGESEHSGGMIVEHCFLPF